jgi:phosphohistidine phosphatase
MQIASMNIYIARHAWAFEFGDPRWPDDSLRELEPDGAIRYREVVSALAERDFAPERIATSPYTRCVQTAQIIAANVPGDPAVEKLEALAPGSDLAALIQWTRTADCKGVCWVGHAPDVGWLTAQLIGDGGAEIRFAKGGIAAIRFEGEIAPGHGELKWLVTAKVLGV